MALTLLTRAGCPACARALDVLRAVSAQYDVELTVVDVDETAADDPELRAEFGDRLPVVLLDGREHSYGEVDLGRLHSDLTPLRGELTTRRQEPSATGAIATETHASGRA